MRHLAKFSAFPIVLLVAGIAHAAAEDENKPADRTSSGTFSGLSLRSIGPAVTSGRVVGFAVHPKDPKQYYVAAASGGVWKTTNAGTTWTPVFDSEGSYSIGVVVIDPKNPHVVWVGTGENNSQRSVGYGDGVYRSDDGGKSWKNMGLKASEHIGKLIIDPRDSNTVYVAAQGPLWGPGGDRGLFKTTDGGKTWKKVLSISENTGVTDVVMDPRNPDQLIAAAYQRRRHVWTLINGGPESAIYRSTDAGATWTKLKTGLPTEELGRIGLALAPSDPDLVYAIIESIDKKGGIFRSSDFGITWEKRNDFDQQAQYYAHLVVDPKNSERVYVMNVYLQVSDDGGKTLRNLGERFKHVDNHTIWIDPRDANFYRVGCDGGVYESWDRGRNWRFVANLPITQFYDVTVDSAGPFYHVYGGTQDNFTLGGTARNRSVHGITNADWFVTQGGDGFHSRVDPQDANTVYSEAQYGALIRYDRRTGQSMGLQPQPGRGEPPLRWNWDSPLIISPHAHTRLYFAANILFRSDDRGDTWKAVSGDLTRKIDRNTLPVMGKVWAADAVSKSVSTSFYGNIVALTESLKKEGLIYVGTDDGLIQVTQNGGAAWKKIDKFPGVPERTYVSRLLASQHEMNTIYAAFENHKNADFAPYLLKSVDAGATWTMIKGDLPANGPVLAIAEDHENPQLLFVGTEFGLYFTVDGGQKWIRLKGGLPTIAVRDLAIQKQMNDLAVGTFGRGIYILDDYALLRSVKPEMLARENVLFPVRNALLYIQTRRYGLRDKAFQGAAFYTANNPPYGATLTYYLKDDIKTRKERRREAEKEAAKKSGKSSYPSGDQLRAEADEEAPAILLTVADVTGTVVRTLTGPVKQGFHRVTWNLREPAAALPRPRPPETDDDLFFEEPAGPLVMPGVYKVQLAKRVDGVVTPLGRPQEFAVGVDGMEALAPADSKALFEFQQKVTRLQRAVSGSLEAANALSQRIEQIKRALDHTPGAEEKWKEEARSLEKHNREILKALRGDVVMRGRNENTPPAIVERVQEIVGSRRLSLARPTTTQREQFQVAGAEFAQELAKLRRLIDVDLRAVEKHLDAIGAPWTPGRLPEWNEK
ncbi:MAG TPA: hypothetical protein VK395_03265 [Gemmataceae bacterium]|nr:hypothetical protein [Gemmataceae bacterium]